VILAQSSVTVLNRTVSIANWFEPGVGYTGVGLVVLVVDVVDVVAVVLVVEVVAVLLSSSFLLHENMVTAIEATAQKVRIFLFI
jgi:hypothetical protein